MWSPQSLFFLLNNIRPKHQKIFAHLPIPPTLGAGKNQPTCAKQNSFCKSGPWKLIGQLSRDVIGYTTSEKVFIQ